jgi:hypothetical protein
MPTPDLFTWDLGNWLNQQDDDGEDDSGEYAEDEGEGEYDDDGDNYAEWDETWV